VPKKVPGTLKKGEFCMKKMIAVLLFVLTVPGAFAQTLAVNANPNDNFPLAIRMAQARVDRFVTTPEEITALERERNKGIWDSVDLINSRELNNGDIEYTLRLSVNQRTRIYTQDFTNIIAGPKNITIASLGQIEGPHEDLSAYDAQRLIDQCREWYANDQDYRRIVDIIEREVLTRLNYDWVTFLGGLSRSYQESIRVGLGICDVYARLTREVLANAGFRAELWTGPHSWNQVTMPNGKILYIESTWYGNCYENHPTFPSTPDYYSPWYITYDKDFFEHGLRRTINMHGAWPDARKVE
jgi:hypothetical protein